MEALMRTVSKVKCIDDLSLAEKAFGVSVPKEGNIYHVRAVLHDGFLLKEVVNLPQESVHGSAEPCFSAEHFEEIRPQ